MVKLNDTDTTTTRAHGRELDSTCTDSHKEVAMGLSPEIDAHLHRINAGPCVQVDLVALSTTLEECAHTQIPVLT